MRFFLCLVDADGRGIADSTRSAYELLLRSHRIAFEWHLPCSTAAVLTGGDEATEDQVVACTGDHVAVGTVRLDNRADLERFLACRAPELSDLDLVLRLVVLHGIKCVPRLLGDFAFVIWDAATGIALAACDPFAVKKLYYAECNGVFAFSSRAEALALDDSYDVQYLAERVAVGVATPGLTPFVEVKSIPGGTLAVLEQRKLTTRQYWSEAEFDVHPAWARAEREAAETCRELLIEAVRLRLSAKDRTWAQLSGGTDSSSVVSIAQWLVASGSVAHGLAGTVTFVDSHGTGADEREYSDEVVRQWRVRNETIIDAPPWYDSQHAPPWTDEPSAAFAVYPRDYRLCSIVRNAGGSVLLTGVGGDELFTGNMFFFADWIVRGRVGAAMREMARRAAKGRVSCWELAYRNALLPLLPRGVQSRLVRDVGQMPGWIAAATVNRYALRARAAAPLRYAGRIGKKYHDAVATGIAAIRGALTIGGIEDTLDVRHPFLYRPLVEFALGLPPDLCARPNARKWVLREAMRGILPEAVRMRVGKGMLVGLFAWSTATQRGLLGPLVRDPILADLGVIDAVKFREAFAAVQNEQANRQWHSAALQYTLGIEAWLQTRSGRWPPQ